MTSAKRAFIKTYGCQMNAYDSERMAELLEAEGYERADAAADADLVVLNTCHIREKAAEKVYSDIGRLRALKDEARADGRTMPIVVAGCVAQAEGEEMVARAPEVDAVFGPQSYHRLPAALPRIARGERVIDTDFGITEKFGAMAAARRRRAPSAFLTVQEGCDKFCAFCVVPYTRGAEVSRPAATVLDEARRLADAGVVELTLLGQNVNAYHGHGPDGSDWSLARLLHALAELPGLKRLRYTTSHPRDMTDDLIEAHRDLPSLMPYLHLPVQSGSNAVLKRMNRRHTRDDYLRLVDRIRRARPDLALSGDFIVGFPGESARDFEDTLSLIENAGYAQAYSFKYSPRPGTPAADHEKQVPEAEKVERLARLQGLLSEQQRVFNAGMEGCITDILLEKPGRRPGQLIGRSPWLQSVHLDAPADMIGQIAPVRVLGVGPNSLSATLLTDEAAA